MINSLEVATISHFGIDKESPLEARRKAGFLFSKAVSRGSWRSFWFSLQGKENKLQDLDQVAQEAQRQPARNKGIVNIPLNQIIGSEGRTNDFDSAFNPRKTHNRDRWIGIAAARRRGIALPPVELIRFGDSYFVRDGNHRVSVAKAAGQAEIEAQIQYVLVK